MRIAIVTDAWHPQVNGVVTTLSRTSAVLGEAGHEVLVINPGMFKTLPCPTYPEIRLAMLPGRRIRQLLDAFAPDAIHLVTEGVLGWSARAYCLKNGLRFTTSYHTRFPEYVRLRAPVPLRLTYAYMRKFHSAATRTMVVTDGLKDELTQYGFRNLTLWSRGVDTEIFKPRLKVFLADPRPIFMFVGRVAVEKNIEEFLRLELDGTKYVVGDGPALKEMRAKYPGVRFTGYKKGEELARHLAAADVFVFPSRTDTFGLVMLEALACGVPVAAFPVTGPKNIIRQGVTGILSDDLRQAANEALVLDGGLCRAFAENFSWERCTSQFFNNLCIPAARKNRVSIAEMLRRPDPVSCQRSLKERG
ncbi:MAG: glycosyltransferase family 1 protein [Desulfurivibrio sp.]|jgi:glycosyltransferase involved in cell wall biosynthesis|nr:MAG: glycosyltransferase family 1 protein [Desulfurivibrio sp.]